jgi:dethiobiotin synthetase
MGTKYIIVGTDTNIGKTVLSSLLMAVSKKHHYWKPIQSGLEEETDSQVVQRLSECDAGRILPEAYRLQKPLSPHLSALLDNIYIDIKNLKIPGKSNLIIETAGGILTPLNEATLQIDLIDKWSLPIVLAVRSSLGTINHTLLTIEALNNRCIRIEGCVMIGEINKENEKAIEHYGEIKILGRIPVMADMRKETFANVYEKNFERGAGSIFNPKPEPRPWMHPSLMDDFIEDEG